ncbi:MAG: fructose-6-phosphate aldolase [candidate division Zixibacteria bacterium]|jgi:transaldolase|nr:fructose-6-phosphate aldolase [candidate division Zixibacteria bacterium]
MRIFIDTANIEEIEKAAQLGVLDGVTTNPSLLAKEKGNYKDILRRICEIVDGPVSAEVTALDVNGILAEANDLTRIHKNIIIKVPVTREGLIATKQLSEKGIEVNMTLCFSPLQALLAAKAGAAYISPFVGRLDDVSHNGMDLIEQIVQIYDNYGFETNVLAASIRHPLHIVDAALMGADVVTVPFKVIEQMIQHPLTDVGIKKFLADWEKVKKD